MCTAQCSTEMPGVGCVPVYKPGWKYPYNYFTHATRERVCNGCSCSENPSCILAVIRWGICNWRLLSITVWQVLGFIGTCLASRISLPLMPCLSSRGPNKSKWPMVWENTFRLELCAWFSFLGPLIVFNPGAWCAQCAPKDVLMGLICRQGIVYWNCGRGDRSSVIDVNMPAFLAIKVIHNQFVLYVELYM